MLDLTAALDSIRPLRELGESTDDLIVCLASADDGILQWVSSPGLHALLGREVDEVVGQPSLVVLAGLTEGGRLRNDRAKLVDGDTVAATYEAQRKDGSTVALRVTGWRVNEEAIVGLAVRAR